MQYGYFLIADILGFGSIVANSPPEAVSGRVNEWISLAERTAEAAGITSVQLVSDTVFAAVDSTLDGLRRLTGYARRLLEEGIAQSLPVRGAVAHGPFEWGRLIFGPAVVTAHTLEAAQDWIGVACDNDLPHLGQAWGIGGLVCYPAPLRSGPIRNYPIVSWNVPQLRALAKHLCGGGLTSEGQILTWNWGRKVTNTAHFGIYLRLLAQANEYPETFHGFLPLEVIELHLLGGQPPATAA
jgi:hypothetical protein